MTTKKARSRRLVRSEDSIDGFYNSAEHGDLAAYIRPIFYHTGRGKHQLTSASLWDGSGPKICITARTRLALHDALIARGWPSPWREVSR